MRLKTGDSGRNNGDRRSPRPALARKKRKDDPCRGALGVASFCPGPSLPVGRPPLPSRCWGPRCKGTGLIASGGRAVRPTILLFGCGPCLLPCFVDQVLQDSTTYLSRQGRLPVPCPHSQCCACIGVLACREANTGRSPLGTPTVAWKEEPLLQSSTWPRLFLFAPGTA